MADEVRSLRCQLAWKRRYIREYAEELRNEKAKWTSSEYPNRIRALESKIDRIDKERSKWYEAWVNAQWAAQEYRQRLVNVGLQAPGGFAEI